ncbi:MAG: glycoside hydrolase family 5 protein [Elusimicrobiota bacterium]|jgi:aryl-phospho-beta-D-glucosidase BglC (GH1 family)
MRASLDFLQVKKGRIVDQQDRPVALRGVNLGSWLLIEGYILGGPNKPEQTIRRSLVGTIGRTRARAFFNRYQDVFVQAADLRRIREWGFNLVRVPFNYRLFLPSPQGNLYERNGFERLDWLVRQCRSLGLYCVLDLHAAPGSQNADWHSDSSGQAGLWTSKSNQEATVRLWRTIAEHFRDEPVVAGYDLLNEPNTDNKPLLQALYCRCVEAIRSAGDRHIVFLEGTVWSSGFDRIDHLTDDQIAYAPHFYNPFQYVFNLELGACYPGVVNGKRWTKDSLRRDLRRYAAWAARKKRPVLIGEFGVNSRCPSCHAEARWVRDAVDLFKSFGFHWTYWTYKTLAGHLFPNGLLQFPPNPTWLRREGPLLGWENWPTHPQKEILRALDSRHFRPDLSILRELQRGLTKTI